jgi:SAM-dependent methyltransferase
MDIRTIDWNEAWKRQNPADSDEEKDRIYWDTRARSFATVNADDPYVKRFLALMDPRPEWRVLDVGCASGTLAVPLAGRVRQVTGLDISPVMLACLRSTCEQRGIGNIRSVQASWSDDWQALGVEPHDVAIASRSLMVTDPRRAIEKLNAFASRRVLVTTPVGEGPLDPVMFRAIGRRPRCGADYIYLYNLLYQMGLQAELNFIDYPVDRTYRDGEEACAALKRKIGELLPQEEKALRDYIRGAFVCCDGRFRRRVPLCTRWALMSWVPPGQGEGSRL